MLFWKGKIPEGRKEEGRKEGGWRGENDSGKIENTAHNNAAGLEPGMRKRGFQGYNSTAGELPPFCRSVGGRPFFLAEHK